MDDYTRAMQGYCETCRFWTTADPNGYRCVDGVMMWGRCDLHSGVVPLWDNVLADMGSVVVQDEKGDHLPDAQVWTARRFGCVEWEASKQEQK